MVFKKQLNSRCEKRKSYLWQDGSARKHPLPMDVQSGSVRKIQIYVTALIAYCSKKLFFLRSSENICTND